MNTVKSWKKRYEWSRGDGAHKGVRLSAASWMEFVDKKKPGSVKFPGIYKA